MKCSCEISPDNLLRKKASRNVTPNGSVPTRSAVKHRNKNRSILYTTVCQKRTTAGGSLELGRMPLSSPSKARTPGTRRTSSKQYMYIIHMSCTVHKILQSFDFESSHKEKKDTEILR